MSFSFQPLELPAEQAILINWLICETWPFHVNPHLSRDDVLQWIEAGIFTGTDHQTFWILSTPQERVGLIRLYDLDDVDDGYPLFDLRIRAAYRGQGIGKQAVQWLTRYLFETWPQLERIAGTTRHDNRAMRQVFRHCGYVKEGHFRRDWDGPDGKQYDTIQYAILREDWVNQTVTPVPWNDEAPQTWTIRPYQPSDEPQWLRCRVLSFLDTAYFDDVQREKKRYANPSIELVAALDPHIIGLIDIECETVPGSVCSPYPTAMGKAGIIWNIAVHPDYQRQGIGSALLEAAVEIATQSQIQRFEAWTRDDASTLGWYEAHGFQKMDSYLHVYLQDGELEGCLDSRIPGLKPVHVLAHYRGDAAADMRQRFKRVHECNRFDLIIQE